MPYVSLKSRKELDDYLKELCGFLEITNTTPGELAYIIYAICISKAYFEDSFANMNQIIGVLESVKQEFYRRVVAPYEDKKIKENGDIT